MDIKPVKIFTRKSSPRLSYIAEIILGDILGLSWEIVTDRRKLGKNTIINYSDQDIKNSFKIDPVEILFENGVERKDIIVTRWNGLPVFFQTTSDSDLPFDIFAASFYLVSRYEEYIDFIPDSHGRFPSSLSLAFKNGFLRIPVIDRWTKELSRMLLKRFNTLTFRRNEYKALITIDSVQALGLRSMRLLDSISDIFKERKSKAQLRKSTFNQEVTDNGNEFGSFERIIERIDNGRTDSCFFFPVGSSSLYDKNPSWRNNEYRRLIKRIDNRFEVGLHTSYFSADNFDLMEKESEHLNNILNKKIDKSRMHYIRLQMPQSYRNMIKTGISDDFSMGFSDEPGFRAGIARPFYFYDLLEDKRTNLRIIPFEVMDSIVVGEGVSQQSEYEEIIRSIVDEIRGVGGLFVSIWHDAKLIDRNKHDICNKLFEFTLIYQES
jgi:hypothetical protein